MEGSPRDLRKSATKRDFLATKPNAWEVKMLRSDLSILIVAFLFALPLIAGEPHHLKIINMVLCPTSNLLWVDSFRIHFNLFNVFMIVLMIFKLISRCGY